MAIGKPKVTLPKKSIQPGPSRLVAGVRVMPKPKPKSKNIGYTPGASAPKAKPKPKTMTDRQKAIAKSMKANPNAELAALSRGVAAKNQARRNASQAAISSVKSQRDAAMKQLEIKRMRDKLKGK